MDFVYVDGELVHVPSFLNRAQRAEWARAVRIERAEAAGMTVGLFVRELAASLA
jgi:hypothetical protein